MSWEPILEAVGQAVNGRSSDARTPSLHLNLGDDYLRAGRVQDAEDQVARAQQAVALLPEHGYGAMIREGVRRLQERVQAETTVA